MSIFDLSFVAYKSVTCTLDSGSKQKAHALCRAHAVASFGVCMSLFKLIGLHI